MSVAEVEVSFDATLDELEQSFMKTQEPLEPTALDVDAETHQVQLYGITTQNIEILKAKCLDLDCSTPGRYDETRRMIGILRSTRTRIEKRRKEHNQEHQDAIKYVNGVAKQLTTFIQNLEDPLKEKKQAVDDAKERAKRAAEDAERAAAEAKIKAEREAVEAQLREQAAKLADERAALDAERARMAAERATIEAEKQEAHAALEAQRRDLETQRLAAERVEFERQAAIRAKREAEEAAVAEAERQAELARRLAAMAPDVDKVHSYGETLKGILPPLVTSEEAQRAVYDAAQAIAEIAASLLNWKGV